MITDQVRVQNWPNCAECVHSRDWHIAGQNVMCTNPNVAIFTDDEMHKNDMIWCDSARDIRCMCGHRARWFEARPTEG